MSVKAEIADRSLLTMQMHMGMHVWLELVQFNWYLPPISVVGSGFMVLSWLHYFDRDCDSQSLKIRNIEISGNIQN